jgi:hypothetical protein
MRTRIESEEWVLLYCQSDDLATPGQGEEEVKGKTSKRLRISKKQRAHWGP